MDQDDKRRYFIVGSVIMEVVTPLFRTRLEKDYTRKGLPSLKTFLNTQPVIHILFHLRHRNARCCVDGPNCYNHPSLPLIYCQWKRLYSEKPGLPLHGCHCKFTANPVKLEDLDVTLASLILLNCCVLTPADDAAIQGLRQYKNDYLSHNTTGRISQTEYKSLWTDLTNFVLQLDPSKQDELDRMEKRPLDGALCNSYVLNLLDVHKKLDEMDTSLQGIRSDIQGQNAHIQEILLYIKKAGCSSMCENSQQQKKDHTNRKQYTIGQDIFRFSHQLRLPSEIPEDIDGSVSDAVMMDDGRLVICLYYQNRFLICNTDGSQVDSIQVYGRPWCVTAVNNSTVAVTLYRSECIEMNAIINEEWSDCIQMYDINSKRYLKSIRVPGMWCKDITTIDNNLVVSSDSRLLIIDHFTENIQTIETNCNPYRLHGSGDKIFYCDTYNKEKLSWYSYTDDRHYNLSLPPEPFSVTELKDGSLYVMYTDGSVQHVSSDTSSRHFMTVDTKSLTKLRGLAYNQKQGKLVTSTKYKGIFNVFCEI